MEYEFKPLVWCTKCDKVLIKGYLIDITCEIKCQDCEKKKREKLRLIKND